MYIFSSIADNYYRFYVPIRNYRTHQTFFKCLRGCLIGIGIEFVKVSRVFTAEIDRKQ